MNFSEIKPNIYAYLGYHGCVVDERTDEMIDECLRELETVICFKHTHALFTEGFHDFLRHEPYKSFLSNCNGYALCVMTLGSEVDRYISRLSVTDMAKAVVADSCASAVLEKLSDEREDELFGKDRTYRFCPGYGGSKVEDVREIFKAVNPKIGVSISGGGLMVPQKSMAGIVGLGKTAKRSCGECGLKEHCRYRQEGVRCYGSENK